MDALAKLKGLRLPFAELLGIEYVAAAPDRVIGELNVRAELCTSPAVMHGGAIMAFADTLGAAGRFLNLPEGARTTTLDSQTTFVRPAPLGARRTGDAI